MSKSSKNDFSIRAPKGLATQARAQLKIKQLEIGKAQGVGYPSLCHLFDWGSEFALSERKSSLNEL